NCCIRSIVNLGGGIFPEVTQPCLIIILEKKFSSIGENIEIIQNIPRTTLKQLAAGLISLSAIPYILCSQTRFHNNIGYEFDIFGIGYEGILVNMEKDIHTNQVHAKPLSALVQNSRGVEINKKGRIIQCSLCKRWNSPPLKKYPKGQISKICTNPKCDNRLKNTDKEDFIIFNDPHNSLRDKPYLIGQHVQRYYIHEHKYIDPTRKGIKYKKSALYQGKKLLLRKTGQGIKIAIDYQNRWVSQVIYIFKIKQDSPVTLEYLLGVLNSVLIQQYFYLKYTDRYRTDFPHFTQKKFLKLPIKIPSNEYDFDLADQIHNTAKKLQSEYQSLSDQNSKFLESSMENSTIKKLEDGLNKLIFEIYDLSPEQQQKIMALADLVVD
ncbi:MAG: TaqI-like C-terminal specificity domain-containing protein, partial [Candidatus Hodarchaeales archaeon]